MEGELKSNKSENTELRKLTTQCMKKSDQIEKELQLVKNMLEEIRKMVRSGAGAETAADGGSQTSRPPASSEVCLL